LRINANIFAPSRSSGYVGIELRQLDGKKTHTLNDLPEGKIMSVRFSPNSQFIAFIVENEQGLTLWNYHLANTKLKQVSNKTVNAALGGSKYSWKRDSSGFYTRLTVANAKDKPQQSSATIEPIVQTTTGKKAAVRTYSNLLKTPYDEALFEFLTRSQLAFISLDGKVSKLGLPGMFKRYSQSPDGKYLLTSQIEKPFSYLVPARRFPLLTQVWHSKTGKIVKDIAKLPSGESIPKGFDSVREGRRSIHWRGDVPATLVWAEAQDGGDMKQELDFHDIVYTWSAPFSRDIQVLQKVERRFNDIEWGTSNFAMISDWRFSDRQVRAWQFNPSEPKQDKVLFEERSYNDRYNDPGNFVHHRNKFGVSVIKLTGKTKVLLTGRGASAKGNIPFLDSFDFTTGAKERLWQSEAPFYERVMLPLNDSATKLLTLRESNKQQPNFFIRDLATKKLTQFSHFPHPSPAFIGVSKELIKYQREDGIELSGTLYLPADYEKNQGRLPVLIWAYPREYKDKKVASQVKDSPYEFVRVSARGPMAHLAQGFAVFDDAQMPIIGLDGALPNDTFREQLVASAKAAVDVLVEKGIADPERMAIAGHSYGAFMVANLLAHSDLFKAGIARSGAYNRTLTPFGFQGEERSFWEGQAAYAKISPIFSCRKNQ
jgi:dipeptidyl aminopeptidase/acylaminoacyl peptidase